MNRLNHLCSTQSCCVFKINFNLNPLKRVCLPRVGCIMNMPNGHLRYTGIQIRLSWSYEFWSRGSPSVLELGLLDLTRPSSRLCLLTRRYDPGLGYFRCFHGPTKCTHHKIHFTRNSLVSRRHYHVAPPKSYIGNQTFPSVNSCTSGSGDSFLHFWHTARRGRSGKTRDFG